MEFEARGGVSGWIGKSGLDEGGNKPDQEGQQNHLRNEKLDWREEDNMRARRAALTTEQREAMNQVRRTSRQINNPPQVVSHDFELRNCTIDDERITDKIKDFYRKLFAIQAVLCSVCLERFPTIKTDDRGVCTRC